MAALKPPPSTRITVTHPAPRDRRQPQRRQELPEALATCAAVIGRHFRGELPQEAVRDGVCRYAVQMHAANVPPERAIAQLKEAILRVPEVAGRPALERGELLRVLVEAAIGAYYSTSSTEVM
jgi:hypothetical protein